MNLIEKKLESKQISEVVESAARQIVDQTEEFIKSICETDIEEDAVTMMLNGTEIKVNKSNYTQLKEQNKKIHLQMKEDVRGIVECFKINLKTQSLEDKEE